MFWHRALLFYFSKLHFTSHQPILVFDFAWNANYITFLQNMFLFFNFHMGGGGGGCVGEARQSSPLGARQKQQHDA
jgi:hypothetical protein